MTTKLSPRALPYSVQIALVIAQALLALTFVGTGIWKLVTPIPKLATMIPWAGQSSPALLYTTAVFDLLGGLGVALPTVTRIKPRLAALAAAGCALLMLAAIVFHLSRGEGANTPFNAFLLALSLFVAWGRGRRAVALRSAALSSEKRDHEKDREHH